MNPLVSRSATERRPSLRHAAIRLVFALGLIAPLGVPVAEACVCDAHPPCSATWQADAVFVGTIVNEQPEPLGASISWVVRNVAVTQTLRGLVDTSITLVPGEGPTAEDIVRANSLGAVSWGGSSCEYGFNVGRQYLIYARRTASGRWTTSRCSGTKPIEEAGEDLAYFASLPTAEPIGRIYGKIDRQILNPLNLLRSLVVPATGVTVALTSESSRMMVTTDADGKLDVRVPPGEYTIAPVVPETVRVYGAPLRRAVVARGCAAVYFSLIANGRIEGRVKTDNGTPVPHVSVDAIPADLEQVDNFTNVPTGATDENGRFSIDGLLPGGYVIGLNARFGPRPESPYAVTYFPGGPRQDAAVIELGEGERKVGFTIVVKALTETKIFGTVAFADDDRPVADAFVAAAPIDPGRVVTASKTDSSGAFQLRLLSGLTYVITARTETPDGLRQVETTVFVDQQADGIRLLIRRSP
jgi:hypothetical protein